MTTLSVEIKPQQQTGLVTTPELKKYYDELRPVFCPYLNDQIHFTPDGWYHLHHYVDRKPRSDRMIRVKIRLFRKYAVGTLRKAHTLQEHRASLHPVGNASRDGLHTTKLFQYFAFEDVDLRNRISYRIIIRKIGDGQHHFWSIIPTWRVETKNIPKSIGRIELEDE